MKEGHDDNEVTDIYVCSRQESVNYNHKESIFFHAVCTEGSQLMHRHADIDVTGVSYTQSDP